jgi:hypothetical protein
MDSVGEAGLKPENNTWFWYNGAHNPERSPSLVYGARLESAYGSHHRGFKSRPLRHADTA